MVLTTTADMFTDISRGNSRGHIEPVHQASTGRAGSLFRGMSCLYNPSRGRHHVRPTERLATMQGAVPSATLPLGRRFVSFIQSTNRHVTIIGWALGITATSRSSSSTREEDGHSSGSHGVALLC